MNKLVKKVAAICILTMCVSLLGGCSGEKSTSKKESGKLTVVTTLFPYYDFVRQIAGDKVDVKMIVPAGMDTHSFEPTAADMVTIGKADLFIYNGGDMESWVPKVIDAAANKSLKSDGMMKHVKTLTEEQVAGMQSDEEEDDSGEAEQDEHIWTSPVNAQKIVAQIAKDLEKADPANKETYIANAKAYEKKLQKLDGEFKQVVKKAPNKFLVFADRFPLRYFVEEYGLKYTAAFAGCSTETEPSAETVAYLTDKVKKDKIPVVLKIELTSSKVADSIAEATGTSVMTFFSCHNVTKQQFTQGVTYYQLMELNVDTLKMALEKAK